MEAGAFGLRGQSAAYPAAMEPKPGRGHVTAPHLHMGARTVREKQTKAEAASSATAQVSVRRGCSSRGVFGGLA